MIMPRTPEHGRDAPVAIELVAQAEQLDMACQFGIGFARSTGLEPAIVAGAGKRLRVRRDVERPTLPASGRSHRFDDFREARTIEPLPDPLRPRRARLLPRRTPNHAEVCVKHRACAPAAGTASPASSRLIAAILNAVGKVLIAVLSVIGHPQG